MQESPSDRGAKPYVSMDGLMRRAGLSTSLLQLIALALGAWCSLGTLAPTEATRRAVRLGLFPPFLLLALIILATVFLAWRLHVAGRIAPRSLYIPALAALPWIPGLALPPLLMWSGGLTGAVWGATALALASELGWAGRWGIDRLGPARAPWIAAGLAFALYLAGSTLVAPQLPGGDEPHYLVITQTLLHDHDLQIEKTHRRGDYRAYFPNTLKPDFLRRGLNGEIYSIHAPGLPALVAPVFAAGGYPLVRIFLALMAALAASLAWRAAWWITGDVGAAWFGWAGVALSSPYFFHAFTVYPDGAGAMLVIVALYPVLVDEARRTAGRPPWGLGVWAICGLALALLPWLHTRYAVLAGCAGLGTAWHLLRRPGATARIALFLAVPLASAAAWFTFFHTIYGVWDPRAPYGGVTDTRLANVGRGLVGLLADQQFGLLPNAPVFAVALIGLVVLWRARPWLAALLALVAFPYTLAVSAYQMWWGGFSSPARFLVPVLLPLAIPAAAAFKAVRSRTARAAALATLYVSLALTAVLAGVDRGALLYNFRDGSARWLQWASALVDLPRAAPSVFATEAATASLQAALWIACLGSAIILVQALERRGTSSSLLAPMLPLAVAVMAMVSAALVWQWNGAPMLTPIRAQEAWLRAINPRWPQTIISYQDGIRPIRLSEALAQLKIGPPPLQLPAPAEPLISLTHVPAGIYTLNVDVRAAGRGDLAVRADRDLPPLASWTLDATPGTTWSQPLRVDAPVEGLSVQASPDAGSRIFRIWLRPAGLLASQGPSEARHATRYGNATVYLVDGLAYLEPSGMWVAGGSKARFVVGLAPGQASWDLRVRNAPVANRVEIEIGGRQERFDLAPGEERMMILPGVIERTLLTISSAAGFQPSRADPSSGDERLLGCWISIR